jgi:hypothetical protein
VIDTVVAFTLDGDITAKPMAIILDAAQSDAVAKVQVRSRLSLRAFEESR